MKIGIQTRGIVDILGPEKGYALIRKAGFDGVDWSLDLSIKESDLFNGKYKGTCIFEKPLDEVKSYFEKDINAIKKNHLSVLQAHAIFPSYVLDKDDVLDYVKKIDTRTIEICGEVGCSILVVHGIHSYPWDHKRTLTEVREMNIAFYSSLIPSMIENNVTVCLENLFIRRNGNNLIMDGCCSDPLQAVQLIDTLNDIAGKEIFGLCLDTGHLNLLRRDPRVYINTLGKRIKATHLNDNDGINDMHKAPFSGDVDWKAICDSFRSVGYLENLSFETFLQTGDAIEFNEELALPWLKVIYSCGEAFAERIKG